MRAVWIALRASCILSTSASIRTFKNKTHAIDASTVHRYGIWSTAVLERTEDYDSSQPLDATSIGEPLPDDCEECKGLIDYIWLFRSLPNYLRSIMFMVLWAAALIWLLNSTAQEYFVPPLSYWSQRLQLSPEIAGATLVALGNGAPDLFAVATAAGSQDLSLGLCELLGANMSVVCVTGGSVFLVAWTIRGQASESKRIEEGADSQSDSGDKVEFDSVSYAFYIATLLYITAVILHGRLTVQLFVPMPIAYLVYLFLLASRSKDTSGSAGALFEAEDGAVELAGMKPPDSGSFFALLGWAVAWPTYAIRWVLIPPADLQWDLCRRILSALSPCGLFCLWILCRPGDIMRWSIACLVAVAVLVVATSLCIFCGSDNGPKVPSFYPALTLLSKISSILVLAIIAGELTALVQAIGVIKGVSRLWLGSTVVAWGNSLGDLVTGIAMVRFGQMRAAMTAVLAGPLFNCLVGSGTAFLIACQQADRPSVFVKGQVTTVLVSNMCFLVVATSFFAIAFRNFSKRRGVWWFGPCVLYSLYAVFLPVTLLQESRA
mmetsp:Transcript_56784/g.88411  ORF Transcript_56784/g.88411 Transcript_56784/m.88411 type:complete len:548 (-) Transcript_56784:52-1695(-)